MIILHCLDDRMYATIGHSMSFSTERQPIQTTNIDINLHNYSLRMCLRILRWYLIPLHD